MAGNGNLFLHCKKYSREFRARDRVTQDHKLPAAESSRKIFELHSPEIFARSWKFSGKLGNSHRTAWKFPLKISRLLGANFRVCQKVPGSGGNFRAGQYYPILEISRLFCMIFQDYFSSVDPRLYLQPKLMKINK